MLREFMNIYYVPMFRTRDRALKLYAPIIIYRAILPMWQTIYGLYKI